MNVVINMMERINKVIRNPGIVFSWVWVKMSPLLPSSELFLKVYYWMRTGRRLNLDNPLSFQEKTQWMKLHYTDPLYTQMVDKYQVRQIVSDKIGEKYLIPLLGVYDSFDEIDFSILPNQFVIKATHDSNSIIRCLDKSKLNIRTTRRRINKRLRKNYFYEGREYPYKNVHPRIIIERLISIGNDFSLPDFKFFCFNGKPELLFVATDRFKKDGPYFTFFDLDWNELPLKAKGHPGIKPHTVLQRPYLFEEMKRIVEALCFDIPFVRIDVYAAEGRLFFGEYTFFHDGGVVDFEPEEWNLKLGEMIHLPTK